MTILFTALALAASAVFFYQITRPTSFLSAILGVEYSRLLAPEPGKPRADGGPTWDTVYAEFRDRLKTEKTTQRHLAVMELLDAVVDVERGRRPAAEALAKSQRHLESDPDNFVSRLCHARLTDAAMADSSAIERFARWREILEQPKPASVAALYNKEFDNLFLEVLSRYIQRLDVRANLVKYLDHYLVTSHYAALPMIQARLSKLADELSGAGKAAEAVACRRWVVRACLGLMEYEPDAGTRLLCADLAARSCPADSRARTLLIELIADYHKRATEARPDVASINRSPNLSPRNYDRVLNSFAMTCSIAAIGIGAALTALGFSVLTVLLRSKNSTLLDNQGLKESTRPPKHRLFLNAVGGVFTTLIVISMALLHHLVWNGVFSENWVLTWIVTMIYLGSLCGIIVAKQRQPMPRNIEQARFIAVIAFFATPICLLPTMPGRVAMCAQLFGSTASLGIALLAAVVLLVGIAYVLTVPGTLLVAQYALRIWCVSMALAVIAWQVHLGFDEPYLSNKVYGYAQLDEIRARLGSWKEEYTVDAMEYANSQ